MADAELDKYEKIIKDIDAKIDNENKKKEEEIENKKKEDERG
jgi:hypothetical protein